MRADTSLFQACATEPYYTIEAEIRSSVAGTAFASCPTDDETCGGQKEVAVHQLADEVDAEAVAHEYAAAFKDYCTTLTSLTEQVRGGHDLSLDQMDQLEAAKLRLENARTLCEFYVSGGVDPAKLRERESRVRLNA